MDRRSRNGSRTFSWAGSIFGLALMALLAGCGPDDPCADTTCEFGTCDSATGSCTNKATCYVDDDCIPGYDCEDRTCVAQSECSSDAECDAGVCNDDGVCVNDSSGCQQNSDCLARTFCSPDGECVPDPCNDITCQRGVCKRGTDRCVSDDSCTERTEAIDCVRGEKCAAGSCEPAESFCDEVSCDRGVCSFDAGGCQDAMDCQGDDSRCLEGDFCNDMNTCRPDLCERNDVTCDRGVCIPSVGQCQNPSSCNDTSDCLANHVCIDGTCRLESVACGDAGGEGGCPGNQNCSFDDGTCSEPEVCQTSFDCKSGRQCAGLNCLTSTMCQADDLEPNDTAAETTDLLAASEGTGQLRGTLCEGDVDRFGFETTDFISGSSDGTLSVTVDVPRRDAGLGGVEVVILKDGTEVTTSETGAFGRGHSVRAETDIGLADHGSYVAEVRAQDDTTSAGVTYDVSVNVVPTAVQQACEGATDLRANQSISGDTGDAPSSSMGSSCTAPDNGSKERVYRIELNAPQQMEFELTPQLSSSNLSMSLRRECGVPSSEQTCVEESGNGGTETLSALLNRGTHYLVVQPTVDGSGGPFELSTTTTFKACTGLDNFCSDAQTAETCASDGGRFRSVACDAGCNPSTGSCFPPAGDVCGDAPAISPQTGSSDAPVTREIRLQQLNDDYQLGSDSCVGTGNASRTRGPDKVYAITLPSMKGVTAEVNFTNEVEGSLYVADTCGDIEGTCQKGAAASTDEETRESLTFSNRSDSEVTRYLVVDTAADQLFDTAQLSLEFKDVICTPGMKQCAGSDIETCAPAGTSYETSRTCGYLCDQGNCQGEVCSNAIPIPNDSTQHSFSLDMGNFTGDYNIGGAACIGSSNSSPGHDAVFQFQADAGEIVQLSWDPPEEPTLYVVSDCTDVGGSCIEGIEAYGSSSVSKTYTVSQAGTYYVMADIDGTDSGIYGTSTLTGQIEATACSPTGSGSCTGSGDFSYCDGEGVSTTYTCSNCCSSVGTGNSAPGTTIPDADSSGITDTLTVSGCSGTVSNMYVYVDVSHGWIGDVILELTGPNGNTATLHDRTGGSASDIVGMYPVALNSVDPLSLFNGTDPNGTWSLNASDNAAFINGTLNSWSIHATCN